MSRRKRNVATNQTERECPACHFIYKGRTLTCPRCGVAAPHSRHSYLDDPEQLGKASDEDFAAHVEELRAERGA